MESSGTTVTRGAIERCLAELAIGREELARASPADLARLTESCLRGTVENARQWVDAACEAKGIRPGSPLRAEEISAGPVTTARHLRLILQSLRDIERHGKPRLPGAIRKGADGRLRVDVFPARGLFDRVAFLGFRACNWMQAGIARETLRQCPRGIPGHWHDAGGKTALVLGAGNVSSIAATDLFTKIFQEGRAVLLKMNPVNDYLGPIFERAYASLIEAGYLRVIYGGADIGRAAVEHNLVDEVHITGSVATHEAIVWGPPGPERERRKRDNDPLLQKSITSELGNVSPWIVVPGTYTNRQLDFQAENIASSITNNASFNCLATKVIITHKNWSGRERLLERINTILSLIPPRTAYYPGALKRFIRFTGREPAGDATTLPWTLLRDIKPETCPQFFREESFVCVAVETGLEADSPEEFLSRAVDFANQRLWGTLCAALTIPPDFRRRGNNEDLFNESLSRLEYGAIGINHWPALIYALMTPPWGGLPGSTLADIQSGIGWVHNTYLLDGIEKTVLEGPLLVSPKPIWFATHPNPEPVSWRLLDLYAKPSLWNLMRLLTSAVS